MTTSHASSIPKVTLNNGVALPALGYGVFQTPPDETIAAMQEALRVGYRHIDTAAAYGNERQVGEAIRRSRIDRSDVFIETKVWISDYGYDATRHAYDKSVAKLGVDQLDLLTLHQPLPSAFDRTIAAYKALQTLLADGKVRAIGGITFYPGYGENRKSTLSDPVLLSVGKAHGKSAAQVMLRWHLQQGRSAIPKSTKPARIAENFDVFDFELSAEQIAAIDALDTGVRSGPDPASIALEKYGRDIPEA